MALSVESMKSYIYPPMQKINDATQAFKRFSELICEYINNNAEITYSWQGYATIGTVVTQDPITIFKTNSSKVGSFELSFFTQRQPAMNYWNIQMANVIKKATNKFLKGLVMDFSPENTRNEVLTHALNATLLTFNGNEMSLQNDMGNARVETAYLPEGYIPVGTCEFGDIILNKEYVCSLSFEEGTTHTIYEFYQDACYQLDIMPTDISFDNGDLIMTGNPFQNHEPNLHTVHPKDR